LPLLVSAPLAVFFSKHPNLTSMPSAPHTTVPFQSSALLFKHNRGPLPLQFCAQRGLRSPAVFLGQILTLVSASTDISCYCIVLNVVYVLQFNLEHPVAQLVEALRCKSDDHEFDSRWCHWDFSLS
jgi:hypothetical protein